VQALAWHPTRSFRICNRLHLHVLCTCMCERVMWSAPPWKGIHPPGPRHAPVVPNSYINIILVALLEDCTSATTEVHILLVILKATQACTFIAMTLYLPLRGSPKRADVPPHAQACLHTGEVRCAPREPLEHPLVDPCVPVHSVQARRCVCGCSVRGGTLWQRDANEGELPAATAAVRGSEQLRCRQPCAS